MLPTFLVALDTTALLLALPKLSAALGADNVEQLWISDSYGFVVAGLVITMGTLGDRIGRRRLLLAGAAAFAVLSVVAAFAANPLMLIVTRALLGVAGATLAPSTLALITNMFRDERRRGKAIAIWASCQFAGGALGPVLAGVLLQYFWWGSVFLISVPPMALLLIAGPALLPEFRGEHAGRLEWASVVTSLGAVLLTIYGIKQLAVGTAALGAVAALIAGLATGAVFARRQLRLSEPLLDLRLLRRRPLVTVLIALVLTGVAMAGTGLLVTQYLQNVLGYSPAESAVLFAPMGLGVAAGTMAAPALAARMRPPIAIAGGLAVSALGSLLLAGVGGAHALPMVMAGITTAAVIFAGLATVIWAMHPGYAPAELHDYEATRS
jgi:DHA2 family multidrug resistance protein-like MFS transporter